MSEENNFQEEDNVEEENSNHEEGQADTGEETKEEKAGEKSEGVNAIAILSYIGILVLVPLLAAKDDEFAQYHAKQGLVLLIAGVVAMFIGVIPILGWILAPLITLACLILAILGIVNVLKKQKKELPVIGKYAKQFKI